MASVPGSVPLCDLSGQYRKLEPEITAAVMRVLSSGQAILGPEVSSFEEEAAAYCGAPHGIGCGSGTDALLLALAALEIGPGDEVILPPFTFFATVGSIVRIGATPVFADIDPKTFNIDPVEVAAKITPRTKAIMPVHLYGQTAEMEPLWELAKKHDLTIIEDAAQAIGAEYRGQRTGTLGDISCFSFYPSKNLGTYGDAGLNTTSNPAWATRMKTLRVHGMEPKYYHKLLGWNARLDAIQAAILRVKLPHLEDWTVGRQEAADRYDSMIDERGLNWFMRKPYRAPERRHVFNQYVLRVANGQRDSLVAHLKATGIGCEIYYPLPLHMQECMAHLGLHEGDFPISEEAARSVIALPMFPEITAEQQDRVLSVCSAFAVARDRKAA